MGAGGGGADGPAVGVEVAEGLQEVFQSGVVAALGGIASAEVAAEGGEVLADGRGGHVMVAYRDRLGACPTAGDRSAGKGLVPAEEAHGHETRSCPTRFPRSAPAAPEVARGDQSGPLGRTPYGRAFDRLPPSPRLRWASRASLRHQGMLCRPAGGGQAAAGVKAALKRGTPKGGVACGIARGRRRTQRGNSVILRSSPPQRVDSRGMTAGRQVGNPWAPARASLPYHGAAGLGNDAHSTEGRRGVGWKVWSKAA